MPAGRGTQCERCYLGNLADKRTKVNQAAFATPTMAQHFMEFGAWLKKTRGPEKAAQRIHRFAPFFLELEREWRTIPTYGELLDHFGAKKLRSVLLAMRWLEESGLVKPDAGEREADSDRRRIEATIGRFPEESHAREILENYLKSLNERVDEGRSSTRSVRLAIGPAASLIEAAMKRGRLVPDQKVLDGYLRKTPGQRAALSGFVTHLRGTRGTELKLPPQDRRTAEGQRRRKLREEMIELMRRGETGTAAERRWMTAALAYFHDMPRKVAGNIGEPEIVPERDGMSVQIGGESYWIPPRMNEKHRHASELVTDGKADGSQRPDF